MGLGVYRSPLWGNRNDIGAQSELNRTSIRDPPWGVVGFLYRQPQAPSVWLPTASTARRAGASWRLGSRRDRRPEYHWFNFFIFFLLDWKGPGTGLFTKICRCMLDYSLSSLRNKKAGPFGAAALQRRGDKENICRHVVAQLIGTCVPAHFCECAGGFTEMYAGTWHMPQLAHVLAHVLNVPDHSLKHMPAHDTS